MVGIQLVTDFSLPTSGALSLARVKEHLRVTGTDEDNLITGYLWAAIHYVQEITGRALVSSTWRQTLDKLPSGGTGPIYLARTPATSVTHVKYTDPDGVEQTIASASLLLEGNCEPARVSPLHDENWPVNISTRPGAVRVTFVAGSATAADTPPHVVHAVYLLVGHWYENRETVVSGAAIHSVPMAVDSLLSLARIPWLDYEV